MKSQALWRCKIGIYGTKRRGCGYWNVYQSKKHMPKRIYKPYRGVKHDSRTSPYSRSCKGSGFGQTRPRQVDTRCRHCDARVRFQLALNRGDSRGRSRRVDIILTGKVDPRSVRLMRIDGNFSELIGNPESRPLDEWTLEELIEGCNIRNRGIQQENDYIGFVRAKNYRSR